MAFLGFILFSFIFASTVIGAEGCGQRHNQASFFVIDGDNAKRGNWPWQALLSFKSSKEPFCGGSLVSHEWVVTAAHCVQFKKPSDIIVTLGETDRSRHEGSEIVVNVDQIKIHSGYSRSTLNNDIALLKLSSSVNYDVMLSPVCLPSNPAPVGKQCFISGWGKMKHPGPMVNKLQYAMLLVVSKAQCQSRNGKFVTVTDQMICGGDAPERISSGCHGDSGGPYVCKNGNSWELQGVVSWGSPQCNVNQAYSVFAKVFQFKKWLMENTGLLFEGTYECHLYDKGGKNDWHYVKIWYDRAQGKYIWTNRAKRSWSLYATTVPDVLRVGKDCPYYNFGNHRTARFTTTGVYGPWGEFYTRK